MIESFYVDNLVTTEDNTDKAFPLFKKSKNRIGLWGFQTAKVGGQ